MVNKLHVFQPEHLSLKNVLCFTTSIEGGCSEEPYRSLNIGAHVGDDATYVNKNRQALNAYIEQQVGAASAQQLKPIKWLNQQHTNTVQDYDLLDDSACDGTFTELSNTPLVVMTADCLPIVMVCSQTNMIAVVHAGWRGLLNGVIESALSHFAHPNSMQVWIGPSISESSFEVSADIIDRFSDYQQYTTRLNAHKYSIDLPSIAQTKLAAAKVCNIERSSVCSYQNPLCFSHRRATHKGLKNTGRMATVVLRKA